MSKIILLTSGTVQMEAELNESKTAALLLDKLPNSVADQTAFALPLLHLAKCNRAGRAQLQQQSFSRSTW